MTDILDLSAMKFFEDNKNNKKTTESYESYLESLVLKAYRAGYMAAVNMIVDNDDDTFDDLK